MHYIKKIIPAITPGFLMFLFVILVQPESQTHGIPAGPGYTVFPTGLTGLEG